LAFFFIDRLTSFQSSIGGAVDDLLALLFLGRLLLRHQITSFRG
jgi:hypothetical protein